MKIKMQRDIEVQLFYARQAGTIHYRGCKEI